MGPFSGSLPYENDKVSLKHGSSRGLWDCIFDLSVRVSVALIMFSADSGESDGGVCRNAGLCCICAG